MQAGPGHLRPRTLPEILDGAVRHYRAQVLSFIVPYIPMAILDLVAAVGLGSVFMSLISETGPVPGTEEFILWGGLGVLYGLVRGAAFMLGTGATVHLAGTELAGKPATLTESWEAARGRAWSLVGIGLLYTIAVGVGFFVLVLPGLYLMIALSLAAHASVLEGQRAMESLSRSQALIRDNFWRAVVLWLFMTVVNTALGTLSNVLSEVGNLFLTEDGSATPFFVLTGLSFVVATAVSLFLTPLYSVLYTHFYWDIRVRKEGLDLDARLGNLEEPDGSPAP